MHTKTCMPESYPGVLLCKPSGYFPTLSFPTHSSWRTLCEYAARANDTQHLLKKAVNGKVAVLITADTVGIEL